MNRLRAHGRAFLDRPRSWDALGSALPIALALAGCILLFGLAGSWLGGTPPDFFELDGEYTAPAYFSGALLLAASVFAWRVHRTDRDRAWACLGALFAFMAFDEVVSVHEHLEDWTGIFWQILYLPVIVVAAVGWFGGVGRARSWEGVLGLVLGAAAWCIAQVFEAKQYGPGGSGTNQTLLVFAEELGEMTGSTLFLLGLLWEGRQRAAVPASDSATSSTATLASSGSMTAASPASLSSSRAK